MQTITVESDLSNSFDNDQPSTEDQATDNFLPQTSNEASLSTDYNSMLNAGKRIGPKLLHNSNNLRTHLKDSPIYSTHNSGVAKAKTGLYDDSHQISNPRITDWNAEMTSTEKYQSSNSKNQSNKSPQSLKSDMYFASDSKGSVISGSKKSNSQSKKGAKSSRDSGENDSNCGKEQENILKGKNQANNKGIYEADINQLNLYRNFSPSAAAYSKQPFLMINPNDIRGNLARARGSYGNLHEKNRAAQPAGLKGEPDKPKQKEQYQSKYILNQVQPRTLNQKIEEQAQIIQKVNLAGREHQKTALKTSKGSEKLKNKKQRKASENLDFEPQSLKLSRIQEKKEFDASSQEQSSKQVEDPKKRLETSNINPSAQAGKIGSSQNKTKTKTTTDASNAAFSTGNQAEPKRGSWILFEEEKNLYGDRCPEEYQKIDLLGKGGFALVWLAKKLDTGERVALKQIAKKNAKDCMQKEIHFGQTLFEVDGIPRSEFDDYPGIKNIIRFIDYKHTKLDTWLVFELGGATLSKMLFEIKGEFFKGERIYNVKHQELWKSFQENPKHLKAYIRQMAEFLNLLSDLSIVHCDIKPDNVLLTKTSDQLQIKVIDFGSAFSMYEPGSFGMATPEYMPPEVLGYLSNSAGNRVNLESLLNHGKSWSIDVWSLGAILLEIVTGVPLWLSLKCKIDTKAKKGLQIGLFAVKGRDYEKIKLRQKAVLENLEATLAEYLYGWENAYEFFNLLQGMLQWDPKLRISPAEILKHCYLKI